MLAFLFLNCGSTYYAIKDGEFPEVERDTGKVNWLAVVGDVSFGVAVPFIVGNPPGVIAALVYIVIDDITGCMYQKKEVEKFIKVEKKK